MVQYSSSLDPFATKPRWRLLSRLTRSLLSYLHLQFSFWYLSLPSHQTPVFLVTSLSSYFPRFLLVNQAHQAMPCHSKVKIFLPFLPHYHSPLTMIPIHSPTSLAYFPPKKNSKRRVSERQSVILCWKYNTKARSGQMPRPHHVRPLPKASQAPQFRSAPPYLYLGKEKRKVTSPPTDAEEALGGSRKS